MITYLLDRQEGRIRRESRESAANEEERKILLLTLEEFQELGGGYPHKKNLLRSLNPIRYCKVENFSDCVQGTMKIPGEKGKQAQFGFYLKEDGLLLVGSEGYLKGALEKIRENAYGPCNLNQFLLILFEFLIEEDVLELQAIEEGISAMEESLMGRVPEGFYEFTIRYRKKLFDLHTYYEQLMNMGDLMQANINQELTKEELASWQHYTNRAERLHNHVEMLREYLIQVRELYQTRIDGQQNRVMSFLTIVTTIFLPLTLIVGWYGMNFPNMPEFRWSFGYPAVIVVSLLVIFLEILYFKKKGML